MKDRKDLALINNNVSYTDSCNLLSKKK